MRMVWIVVAVLAAGQPALGDSLYLTNGAVLEGKIIAERDREVILRLDSGGVLTIKKADLKGILRPGKGMQTLNEKPEDPEPTPSTPSALPPMTEHKGPHWRIEIPSTFIVWQQATAPPDTRRLRDASTGAAVCVMGPEEPVLEGKRPRPIWALPTVIGEANGKLVSKKKVEIGGRAGETAEVQVELAGKRFREFWASVEGGGARVVCACPQELADLYRPIFERCLQTFRSEAPSKELASTPAK